jgi:hypothetical protein
MNSKKEILIKGILNEKLQGISSTGRDLTIGSIDPQDKCKKGCEQCSDCVCDCDHPTGSGSCNISSCESTECGVPV